MKHYGFSDFHWNGNKLYLGSKKVKYSFIEEEKGQFRITYPDGQKSEDFYNLSRVKQNAILACLQDMGEKGRDATSIDLFTKEVVG